MIKKPVLRPLLEILEPGSSYRLTRHCPVCGWRLYTKISTCRCYTACQNCQIETKCPRCKSVIIEDRNIP